MPLFDEDEAYEQIGREPRRHLSFGGEGETILDVMDRADIDAHESGLHDEHHPGCPLCEEEVQGR